MLEKGLDFAPIQKILNEPELRKDFKEFSRRMRCKWNFRNEPTNNFSEIAAFRPKSEWKRPKGHASLEVFLSRVEKELFSDEINDSTQSNHSGDEWKTLRNLADDRSIVINGADKGSSVAIWDREDYLQEASKQLQDTNIYEDVNFNENILTGLVERSNKIFSCLCSGKLIYEKELKYFTYSFKKATNLGKLYFLPKIHKRLSSVPGRPVISNCSTPTEKISEYLDHILKPVMQESWSYIKNSGDFLKKVKHLGQIPEGAFLVTADAVGLYPSIPRKAGLKALRRRLNKRENFEITTEDIVHMAEFKNDSFEFNGEVKRQKSGTAIGTSLRIFMDEVEAEFLKSQELQPFLWLHYIDDIFFVWTHGTQELDSFLNGFNKFHPNLSFTYETSKKRVNFLDLNVSIRNGAISTDLYIKPTDGHQYLDYKSSHQNI